MKKAIYALSADPITKGHLNVIERAAKMFDELIIGIGNNEKKNYLFKIEKRTSMTVNSIKAISKETGTKITVQHFSGTLADFAFEQNATVVVRGLRNINDFQEEQNLANINKTLNSNLETCFILTEGDYASISSSAAKEVIKNFYTADEFLPITSKINLQYAINQQIFIGITGLMGSGKSYIAQMLDTYSKNQKHSILNLDLDILCHEVYDETKSEFEKEREDILNYFGTLDRSVIGSKIGTSRRHLEKLNSIFEPVIKYQVRKYSKNSKQIILINGATIISMGLLSILCNNQIVMVKTKDSIRFKRCEEKRGISEEIIKTRDEMIINYDDQKEIIEERIEHDGVGFIIEFENNKDKPNIAKLYDMVSKKVFTPIR